MASHQLAIAKASFTAGLLRPDPVSVSRDEISHFHDLVNSVVNQCSPTNIQNCKRWILRNVSQSTVRFTALGKYLTALSISFDGPAKPSASTTSQREPSEKRKRLHLLYLINDLLHHAKFHANDASVASKVQPLLFGLFSSAASFRNSPKHHRKIEDLLDIWEYRNYYSMEYIERLHETVRIARDAEHSTKATQSLDRNGGTGTGSKPHRNIPFVMPAMHGDQGTPWYDLPAGNLMPHITPNSTRPLNPNLVKPLRFVTGPAGEDLASAVKNLLQDVNNIFGIMQFQDQHENVSWDIDELGQAILHDDVTGEAFSSEGYYGWSTAFCEKMKRRRKGFEHDQKEGHNERRSRSRSRSHSQSSSLSSNRYKRRRFSNSDEEGSRSRSRSRSGSRGRSNSRSRRGRRAYSNSRSPSRDESIPLQRNNPSSTSYENISRSTSQDRNGRDVTGAPYASQPQSLDTLPDVVREPFGRDIQSITALQQALLPPTNHHFSSGVIPIPPPPPPHYAQWPPQQPLPASIIPYTQEVHPAGSWPPPPPPFPQQWSPASYGQMPSGQPPQGGNGRGGYGGRGRGGAGHSQQHHHSAGSGYNGYRGNGRGNGWS